MDDEMEAGFILGFFGAITHIMVPDSMHQSGTITSSRLQDVLASSHDRISETSRTLNPKIPTGKKGTLIVIRLLGYQAYILEQILSPPDKPPRPAKKRYSPA